MKTETFFTKLFFAVVLLAIVFVCSIFYYNLFGKKDFITPDTVEKKDTIQTFETSKYYSEYKCWQYRKDTSDQNMKDIFVNKMTEEEYILNSYEFNESDANMRSLLKLYRKDQSPCK